MTLESQVKSMNERNNIRPRACKECGRSFLGGPMSYESNDTADKERQSTLYLKEILNYIENKTKNEVKNDKFDFLMHLKDNIKNYLDFPG